MSIETITALKEIREMLDLLRFHVVRLSEDGSSVSEELDDASERIAAAIDRIKSTSTKELQS